ncbi:MAG: hypothetical protein HYZ57_14315, partial [Acidobacteria bacterium]|nr:hypothetical protein [Acidobacteriota bacterium]
MRWGIFRRLGGLFGGGARVGAGRELIEAAQSAKQSQIDAGVVGGGLHEDALVIAVGAEQQSLAGGSGGIAEPFLKVGIELTLGDVEGAGLDVGDAQFAPGGEGEVVDQDLGG